MRIPRATVASAAGSVSTCCETVRLAALSGDASVTSAVAAASSERSARPVFSFLDASSRGVAAIRAAFGVDGVRASCAAASSTSASGPGAPLASARRGAPVRRCAPAGRCAEGALVSGGSAADAVVGTASRRRRFLVGGGPRGSVSTGSGARGSPPRLLSLRKERPWTTRRSVSSEASLACGPAPVPPAVLSSAGCGRGGAGWGATKTSAYRAVFCANLHASTTSRSGSVTVRRGSPSFRVGRQCRRMKRMRWTFWLLRSSRREEDIDRGEPAE